MAEQDGSEESFRIDRAEVTEWIQSFSLKRLHYVGDAPPIKNGKYSSPRIRMEVISTRKDSKFSFETFALRGKFPMNYNGQSFFLKRSHYVGNASKSAFPRIPLKDQSCLQLTAHCVGSWTLSIEGKKIQIKVAYS
jgi:hypothetical protein